MEHYDESLFAGLTRDAEGRHALQRDFLAFLRDLAAWTKSQEGRRELRDALRRNFAESNVTALQVSRGPGSRPVVVNLRAP